MIKIIFGLGTFYLLYYWGSSW